MQRTSFADASSRTGARGGNVVGAGVCCVVGAPETRPIEAWGRRGTANNAGTTVRALPWILAGHEIHHVGVLRDRYL